MLKVILNYLERQIVNNIVPYNCLIILSIQATLFEKNIVYKRNLNFASVCTKLGYI